MSAFLQHLIPPTTLHKARHDVGSIMSLTRTLTLHLESEGAEEHLWYPSDQEYSPRAVVGLVIVTGMVMALCLPWYAPAEAPGYCGRLQSRKENN
ncbi:hypothetical protein Pcinc_023492 [Petrolisthes cinctipes]|uniref:Uncharacterized protein n=1 Tax=Petrolisthes cinctipes TaxID=88211 RepID=A0AAE1KGS5_PETCI|nr:hypothetical protein Pcinc_023492 [Petrolisthes cinctipes]